MDLKKLANNSFFLNLLIFLVASYIILMIRILVVVYFLIKIFHYQTSLLRSLKPTERVVKYMDNLDRSPEEEAEEKLKKEKEAEAIAYEAFGF